MARVINLPSGATVTVRDVREFKQKDRAAIQQILGDDTINAGERSTKATQTLFGLLIEEWSFDLIPPNVKPESIGELSLPDYDALEVEGLKAMDVLFPSLKNADADPDSPLQK